MSIEKPTLRNKSTDYCYNCGHKLGEHRMSGRCDFFWEISELERKKCGCKYHGCNCQQFEVKAI